MLQWSYEFPSQIAWISVNLNYSISFCSIRLIICHSDHIKLWYQMWYKNALAIAVCKDPNLMIGSNLMHLNEEREVCCSVSKASWPCSISLVSPVSPLPFTSLSHVRVGRWLSSWYHLQSNPDIGSAMGLTKNGTNKRIEPLTPLTTIFY